MLLRAVRAEQDLIGRYGQAAVVYPPLAPALAPLLAEHRQHLDQLRARIIEPPGRTLPATVTSKPAVAATRRAALAQLREAEQSAVTALLSRLADASPSLAQLYASIAASESTHVTALTDQIGA